MAAASLHRSVAQGKFQIAVGGAVVEGDEEPLTFRLTQKNIGRVVGSEMPELAAAQGGLFAANAKQRLNVFEDVLLGCRAAIARESVFRIVGPAAGEVAAIVGIATAGERDFVAVIEFGNSAKRQGQRKREF